MYSFKISVIAFYKYYYFSGGLSLVFDCVLSLSTCTFCCYLWLRKPCSIVPNRNILQADYEGVNEFTWGSENKIHWTCVVPDDGHFSYIKSQQIHFSREQSGDGEYPDKMD